MRSSGQKQKSSKDLDYENIEELMSLVEQERHWKIPINQHFEMNPVKVSNPKF